MGTVYVANGAGSGSWSSIGTSAFTGMVADFLAPVAPAGWLELDGSIISTSTYSALYGAMSITTSGTRTNGSAVVTSIPDTSNFRAGYYVFGTGIASGTTILSVDSASQITLSANASSSGSSAFAVSPWLMNTGTIQLPNVTGNGYFRRSRTASTKVGDLQASAIESHTHTGTYTGPTDSQGSHNHTTSVNDPGHSHSGSTGGTNISVSSTSGATVMQPGGSIGSSGTGITVGVSINGAHTHTATVTGTSNATGGAETRPYSLVLITCVKT